MADWNTIFKDKGIIFKEVHPDLNKIIKFLKVKKAVNVLDLGSGSGRHTIALAKAGFNVTALDVADSGLKLTKDWLKKEKLKAKIIKSSVYDKLPFKSKEFDFVISTQVIHHAKIKNILYCISEIKRVLKPKAYIFITLSKRRYIGKDRKIIAPRTYIPLGDDVWETGVPHYIFNKQLIKKHFKDFDILKLYLDNTNHYAIFGRLK